MIAYTLGPAKSLFLVVGDFFFFFKKYFLKISGF